MSRSDPEVVRREYASEAGLRARSSVYGGGHGAGAIEAAFAAVREARLRHLAELWSLVGRSRERERPSFFAETGEA